MFNHYLSGDYFLKRAITWHKKSLNQRSQYNTNKSDASWYFLLLWAEQNYSEKK